MGKVDKNELVDEFSLLMSYYRGNGQTQGKIESKYVESDRIVCLPYTLEKQSLDENFNNYYVFNQIKKIEGVCSSELKVRTIGKSYESYEGCCKCEKSNFYILITNYLSIDSPLTCGTCNKSVPLYKFPKYYDFGYMPILSWQSNYISCDSLQMNCEVGEQWALNQMQQVNSELSKQGIEICKNITKITSISTYYYLHNYKELKGNQLERTCPNCSNRWNLENQLHNIFDFKCDNCNIVSTVSPNV